jgi:hypothetical protein
MTREPRTPFEAAVCLIEAYVLRGDDPNWIRKGLMGVHCGTWSAKIGGSVFFDKELTQSKRYGADKIIVERVNGKDCVEVFSFTEIYQSIKSRSEQPALFKV